MKRNTSHITRILPIAICVSLILCGCGKQPTAATPDVPSSLASPQEEKLRVGVVPKGSEHEFWKSIHAGAVKAGRELDVEVIWQGPYREDDREQQIQVVENFISMRVDGLVVAPLDDKALIAPLKDARNQGIRVVIIDSGLLEEEYESFVATDNYKGGVRGAGRLAELLGGKGDIIMMRYQEGSASTMKREKGFLDTIEKEFPDINVVSSNRYGGATTESAYQEAENLINRFPDIDGIFCPNESTAFGMLRALQDAGMAGKVWYVGFDSSPKLVEALRNGEIHGLVLQDPINMGYLGVKTAVQVLKGETVERRIDTGSTMITKEDMDEPRNKELLEPPFEEWLGS